ncbi:transposase for insertion sequence element [Escherichia coli M056]|nr:transposase for insertion sequence element [Escherichia coli M056]
MLYEQFGDLKFKYRNREFWCRGYYVDTVGKNTAKIQDYIKHQLEEDKNGGAVIDSISGQPVYGP